ncbi:hypothetical protein PspLS_10829 [Pyricularia sp. CBS 133598]|nr:hypothetical protein PspLS_10829 [Pyricularia sp. CBS 133598]
MSPSTRLKLAASQNMTYTASEVMFFGFTMRSTSFTVTAKRASLQRREDLQLYGGSGPNAVVHHLRRGDLQACIRPTAIMCGQCSRAGLGEYSNRWFGS